MIILNTKTIHITSVKIIWKIIYILQFQIVDIFDIKIGTTNCSSNFSIDISLVILANYTYHPILKLISAMHNFGRSINDTINKMKSLIIYSSDGRSICLNNWQDKYYFIDIFSTLFLFEDGKYLAKYKTVISLKVWANWTIEYYNCW